MDSYVKFFLYGRCFDRYCIFRSKDGSLFVTCG